MSKFKAFSYTSLLVTTGAGWLATESSSPAIAATEELPPNTADVTSDAATAMIMAVPVVPDAIAPPEFMPELPFAPVPWEVATTTLASNPAEEQKAVLNGPQADGTAITLATARDNLPATFGSPAALPETHSPKRDPKPVSLAPTPNMQAAAPEMTTVVPQFAQPDRANHPEHPSPSVSASALELAPVELESPEFTWSEPLPSVPEAVAQASITSGVTPSASAPTPPASDATWPQERRPALTMDGAIAPEVSVATPSFSDRSVATTESTPPQSAFVESAMSELATPESATTVSAAMPNFNDGAAPATEFATPENFEVFPVGINIDSRNVIETTLVKGAFDGEAAVAFDRWLLPFDDVIQALRFTVTPLTNGDLELRSPGAILRLNPGELRTDPDLGLALSVTDIETILGVPTEFDRFNYAIVFSPPWGRSAQNRRPDQQPILTEGLPTASPADFRMTGVAQEFTASGSPDRGTRDSQASFSAIGGAFNGSWFFDINQPTPGNFDTWRLQEFQYLRPSDTADIALGSQPTFWPSEQSVDDFWGVSYIRRWGFEPQIPTGAGGFDPQERLQAEVLGRSIVGEAEPGTLVQLTQGFSNFVIDEVLVDSSGLYRFDDVPVGGGLGRYEVRLFPNGQLTATPEVQPATFTIQAGQLPPGASALAVSGGFNRQPDSFFGSFEDFRGGVTYRHGIAEGLTLGGGFVQDQSPQVLTEAFFTNDDLFPMQAAVTALVDLPTGDIDLNADVRLQPTPSTRVSFRSDRFSTRLDADWTINRNFALTANADSRDEAVELGTRFNFSGSNFYVFGSASIDSRSRLRWNLNSRAGAFGLRHYGDDITTQTQLLYNLSSNSAYDDGHALLLDYETRTVDGDNNQLGALSWRYRSEEKSVYGRPLWDVQLGYAIGSEGEGPIAQVTSGILPGVDLSLRYQAVSAVSGEDSFRIEISPRLNLQNRVALANERQEWLRTQGGLLLEPFLDEDGDGERDPDEPIYNDPENLDLLLSINNQNLNRFRPDIRDHGAFVTLPPGMYRVDLDPAGYPIDWSPVETAYAANTSPGQFTHLEIPLQASYTLTGIVTDETGTPLAGQRIEAISRATGKRLFSVTNAAGVFYLEDLTRGTYRFEVQESAIANLTVTFDQDSETFQELNFTVMSDGQIFSRR